jgi:hypothetical protein
MEVKKRGWLELKRGDRIEACRVKGAYFQFQYSPGMKSNTNILEEVISWYSTRPGC